METAEVTEARVQNCRVDLSYPVEREKGEPIDHLVLRRLTAKEAIQLDKIAGDRQTLGLIALIARVPIDVVERLDVDDFEEVSKAAVPFMPRAMRRLYEKMAAVVAKLEGQPENVDLEKLIQSLSE